MLSLGAVVIRPRDGPLIHQAPHPFVLLTRKFALSLDGGELRLLLRVSSSIRMSPCWTARPDSKAMRSTIPGRSALTVTPEQRPPFRSR